MWVSAIGCAISGNTVYEISSSNPAVSLGSPSSTQTVGCLTLPLDNDAVMTWDASGHVYYNDDGSWHQISGLVVSQIVGNSKGAIFGFDTAGHP